MGVEKLKRLQSVGKAEAMTYYATDICAYCGKPVRARSEHKDNVPYNGWCECEHENKSKSLNP